MRNIRSFFHRHGRIIRNDAVIIAVFLAALLGYFIWQPDFLNADKVRELTVHIGSWGPWAIIIFIVLEVVIAPIPGGLIPLAVGALYGIWPGWLYVFAGNIIGSLLAFWVARKAGRWIAYKLIPKHHLKLFEKFVGRNRFLFWVIYCVPLLPMDTASFAAGLSKMPFYAYLRIIIIGFGVHLFLLTAFGEQIVSASHEVRVVWGFVLMAVVVGAVTVNQLVFAKQK